MKPGSTACCYLLAVCDDVKYKCSFLYTTV